MSKRRNIFSIPSGVPFLPTLVDSILDGTLLGCVGSLSSSPFSLSDITIFVPTRRAMRELTRLFRERSDGSAILLPMIRALGSMDEDELYFSDFIPSGSELLFSGSPEPVSRLSRSLRLSVLIQHWARVMNQSGRRSSGEILTSSPSQAFEFAEDLSALLDQATSEGVDWSQLDKIDCGDYSQWWQRTQDFLRIATDGWRKILDEEGLIDESQLRIERLSHQAQLYESGKYVNPVIAAGSTGSVATTTRLLRSIANMECGALVLPGLDMDMSDDLWESLEPQGDDSQLSNDRLFSHPQYGLRHLLLGLDILRSDVRVLPSQNTDSPRRTFISRALVPSDSTGLWREHSGEDYTQACDGISVIVAPDEHKEALAIALAMREALETPTTDNFHSGFFKAALVTPDRNLARRVSVQLHRFGISVDDSAGRNLVSTSHGIFLRLVSRLAYYDEFDSVALLSLLHHRLSRFGGESANIQGAWILEYALLRGSVRKLSFGILCDELERVRSSLTDNPHLYARLGHFSDEDWQFGFALCRKLDDIFTISDTDNFITTTIKIAESVAMDNNGNLSSLYTGVEGREVHSLLSRLSEHSTYPDISPSEFPDFFEKLLSTCTIRPVYGTHPDLVILGPLEARLQSFDRVILGGLNERVWPSLSSSDLFLSRFMKSQLGLPQPERRIGLGAHDFQMLMGIKDVILTRSEHLNGSPTLASRWLQRLTTLAGEDETENMKKRGNKYLDWSILLDEPPELFPSITAPSPCPPVVCRPRSLSISDIGRWIENPYEIYAKHILRLRPLDSLRPEFGPMQRGLLFHDIFDDFISTLSASPDDLRTHLRTIAERHFASRSISADIAVLWRPRLLEIIDNFLDWHESYYRDVAMSFTEIEVKHKFENLDFTIRGRVDRIDKLRKGGVIIYDYKTGDTPHINRVRDLQSPQLPLEGLLASLGAFDDLGKAMVDDLAYIRLRGNDNFRIDYITTPKSDFPPLSEFLQNTYNSLSDLVRAFDNPSQPYLVKRTIIPRGKYAGYVDDYVHLARTMEWSLSEDDEDNLV